jgi:hypothetical protein
MSKLAAHTFVPRLGVAEEAEFSAPIDNQAVLRLTAMTLISIAPCVLTMVPFSGLLKKLLGIPFPSRIAHPLQTALGKVAGDAVKILFVSLASRK